MLLRSFLSSFRQAHHMHQVQVRHLSIATRGLRCLPLPNQKSRSMADQLDDFIGDVLMDMPPNLVGVFGRPPNFQFIVNGRVRPGDHIPIEIPDHEQVVHIIWLLGIFPLPVVNYSLLWRRNRPQNWRQALIRSLTTILLGIVRMGRILGYFILAGGWIRDIVRHISIFGNMVAFSDNFFQDIFTYALRNYPLLVQRKYELEMSESIEWNTVDQCIIDTLAWNIRTNCVFPADTESGAGYCTLHLESLIFRFSKALLQVFPFFNFMPSAVLTLTTIVLYMSYGLIGQFLGFNVIFFFSLHSFHRWMKFFGFMGQLGKTLWHSTGSLVF